MSSPNDNFAKPSAPPAPKPTQRPGSRPGGPPGIHAVQVNQAREMVQLHTRGRVPAPSANHRSTLDKFDKPILCGSMKLAGLKQQQEQQQQRPQPEHQRNAVPGIASTLSSSFPKSSNYCNEDCVASAAAQNVNISIPAKAHEGETHNPQCNHCGKVIIPSPQSSFPFQDKPSITINDWSIFTIKKPILNSPELDFLNDNRFDFPLPEMIFGNNIVRLVNDKTGESLEFNALDALDSLEPDCKLKVSYHKEWLSSRRSKSSNSSEKSEKALKENSNKDIAKLTDNLDVLKPYDWTYSTNYKGTTTIKFSETDEKIPIEKLLKPDPILFFDESILFEDELGDNGISMLSTKIRVMPTCLLLLCRLFLRIDNVIFRVRDTRVYIDLETNQVLREYKEQEHPYDDLLASIDSKTSNDPKRLLRDTNWVAQNIPVVSTTIESSSISDK